MPPLFGKHPETSAPARGTCAISNKSDPPRRIPGSCEKGNGMIGLLVVNPLLLLGGVAYLGYRLFYKPMKSHLDARSDGEFTRGGGIDMKRCPECDTYIRGDAIGCPSCDGEGLKTPPPKDDIRR